MWNHLKKLSVLIFIFASLTSALRAQEVQSNFIIEGIKLYDKGDYEGALDMYKKALASNPASVQAKYEIATAYMQLKDYTAVIKYAEKVIANNTDYVDQAYVLKGSALDYLKRPKDAAETYKQAIKKFPKNQSLYYNLAVTSFGLNDYKQTDDALMRSLKLDQLHASSHFLLGLSMITQGKRVQAILALYNFLLLEPKTKRSSAALQALQDEWKKGTVKEKPASKTEPVKEEDEFYTAGLMLDVLESSKNDEANKNKPELVLFTENTNTFFNILGEAKKDKKGFWWNFYVDYFYTLATNKHTEALCHYITQSKDSTYDAWISDKANLIKMQALSDWYTKYLHKY